MAKGTTKSGFKYSVNNNVTTDIRILESLKVIQNPASEEMAKIDSSLELLEIVLGSDQKKALYEHVAAKNGGVADVSKVMNEFTEIFEAVNGKKSSSSPE